MNTSKESEKTKVEKAKLKPGQMPGETLEPLNDDEMNPENITPPAVVDETGLDEIFDQLEDSKTPLQELTGNYIELDKFKEGEERAYICTGKTTFTTKDNEVKPAVMLLDRERKSWICASTVIVNSLMKVEKFPVGCKILYKGKKKSAAGTYHDVQVFVL